MRPRQKRAQKRGLLSDHSWSHRGRWRDALACSRRRCRRAGRSRSRCSGGRRWSGPWGRGRTCRGRTHPFLGHRVDDATSEPLGKHRPPRPERPHVGQAVVAAKSMGPGLGEPPEPTDTGGTTHDAVTAVAGDHARPVTAGSHGGGHGQNQNHLFHVIHLDLLWNQKDRSPDRRTSTRLSTHLQSSHSIRHFETASSHRPRDIEP